MNKSRIVVIKRRDASPVSPKPESIYSPHEESKAKFRATQREIQKTLDLIRRRQRAELAQFLNQSEEMI